MIETITIRLSNLTARITRTTDGTNTQDVLIYLDLDKGGYSNLELPIADLHELLDALKQFDTRENQ